MTRTKQPPDSARGPISKRRRPAAALLVGIGLVLLPIALSPAPLGAAPEPGLAVAPVQQVDEAGSGEGAFRVRDPGQRWDEADGRWRWRIAKPKMLLWGAVGFFLALFLLLGLFVTIPKPTLAQRRWFSGRTVRGLGVDPLVLAYLLAAGAFAMFLYSGAFVWLSAETKRVAELGAGGAAALFTSLAGVLFTKGEKRKRLIAAVAGEGPSSFLGLMRVGVDDDLRRRVKALAEKHEVGLIQRALCDRSKEALDQGRLQTDERKEFVDELLGFQPGENERSDFLNRQAVLHFATRLVTIEDLEDRLPKAEGRTFERRKSTNGRMARERRAGQDRRVRSVWTPPDRAEFELAG